jgi:hypothetical protein
MKTLNLVLLAVMVAVTGYAQETKVEKPKALVKAQEAYEKEAARVLEPVNLNYLKTLESIKRDLGVRGDTAGMVAVQAAIDEVKEYLKNEPGDPFIGDWQRVGNPGGLTVNADGTFTKAPDGSSGRWEKKGSKYICHWQVGGSGDNTFTITRDGTMLTLRDDKDKNFKFTRREQP